MPTPEIIPDQTGLYGYDGMLFAKFNDRTTKIPWNIDDRKNMMAQAIVIDTNSGLGIAQVSEYIYNMNRKDLKQIVCVDMINNKILGYIKMPDGAPTWIQYDKENQVLMLMDYSWKWIAMIDLAHPNTGAVSK
jgi:hypothetical protein